MEYLNVNSRTVTFQNIHKLLFSQNK